MSKLIRWSELPDDAARAGFLERFKECGHELRPEPYRPYTPGPQYTDMVLRLALGRPSELLVAAAGGRVTARAAVMRCASREGAGLVGLYEAGEGREGDATTERILEAALEWATTQGLGELFAPVDSSTWFSYRFTVPASSPGSDRPPYHWEPTHPPSYLSRFRQLGFEDVEFFETRGFDFPPTGSYGIQDAARYASPAWEAARDAGFGFHRLNDELDAIPYEELHRLSTAAFRDNALFEPLSVEAFRGLYASAMTGAAADFTHWVRDPDGQLCAFVFAFSENDEVVIKSIAVDPLARGRKLSTALVHLVLEGAHEKGISSVVSALVRRGNTSEFLGKPHLMPGVATWTREYVLLRRALEQ